jgi:hypothetical protein
MSASAAISQAPLEPLVPVRGSLAGAIAGVGTPLVCTPAVVVNAVVGVIGIVVGVGRLGVGVAGVGVACWAFGLDFGLAVAVG